MEHGEILRATLNWESLRVDRGTVRPVRDRCTHGHDYTPENTYVDPDGKHYRCRACRRNQLRLVYLARTRFPDPDVVRAAFFYLDEAVLLESA